MRLRGIGAVDDDLGDAVAVAKVEEDELPVVAAAVHPAGQAHVRADVAGAKGSAGVRPVRSGEVGGGLGHGRVMVAARDLPGRHVWRPGPPRVASPAAARAAGLLEAPAGRDVPADELAAEIVRGPLAGRALGAAPAGEAALVRQVGDVAGALRRVAVPAVAVVVAVDVVLAGAGCGWRRRADHARRERVGDVHAILVPLGGRPAAARDRSIVTAASTRARAVPGDRVDPGRSGCTHPNVCAGAGGGPAHARCPVPGACHAIIPASGPGFGPQDPSA